MDGCTPCALGLHNHSGPDCGCPNCHLVAIEDLEENERLDRAVNDVARRVVANLAEQVGEEWGNYPEIGEGDWLAVQDRVAFMAAELNPDDGDYFEAYGYLEQRAVTWERAN